MDRRAQLLAVCLEALGLRRFERDPSLPRRRSCAGRNRVAVFNRGWHNDLYLLCFSQPPFRFEWMLVLSPTPSARKLTSEPITAASVHVHIRTRFWGLCWHNDGLVE